MERDSRGATHVGRARLARRGGPRVPVRGVAPTWLTPCVRPNATRGDKPTGRHAGLPLHQETGNFCPRYGCLAFTLLVRKIRFVLRLGVNIDHVATLREARYRQASRRSGLIPEPDPVLAAKICEAAGAYGITVHLREDRRHIRDHDLRRLRATVRTRLNLEMAATSEILSIALRIRPDITCIVPEKRAEVTTEGGLDVRAHRQSIAQAIRKLHGKKIPVSLFVDSNPHQISAAAEVGADYVELHTGAYANARLVSQPKELKKLIDELEKIKNKYFNIKKGV